MQLSSLFYTSERSLVGLVVRAFASKAEDQRVRFPCEQWGFFFPGRGIPVDLKTDIHWLPCQVPGATGSALGVVDPVSVHSAWVR